MALACLVYLLIWALVYFSHAGLSQTMLYVGNVLAVIALIRLVTAIAAGRGAPSRSGGGTASVVVVLIVLALAIFIWSRVDPQAPLHAIGGALD